MYLPENSTVASFSNVGKNGVTFDRFHRDRVGFVISSWFWKELRKGFYLKKKLKCYLDKLQKIWEKFSI